MRRRLKGITLLFILASPVMVTHFWFQRQKSVVKHEIKCRMIEGMDKDELVLIKLSREASGTLIRWEHPGEFEYNHQMYDVVESGIQGDTVYYWCWWDHAETRLNRQLAELVLKAFRSDPQRKEKQERLNTYFQSLYCSHLFRWNSSAPAIAIGRFIPAADLPSSLYFPPPKPPPRLS
jgi:hypothetical protein